MDKASIFGVVVGSGLVVGSILLGSRTLVLHGQDPKRIRAESYGEYRPIADNATPGGRALNRRVELMYARSDILAAVRSWAGADAPAADTTAAAR